MKMTTCFKDFLITSSHRKTIMEIRHSERTKLGVHNAERPPIKVESATKTAEIPHQTQPPVDEISGKEIPRLIPDIEASDNGHIVATSEADGSALKPSSTKSDSSSNVNILTKKAQPIKGIFFEFIENKNG